MLGSTLTIRSRGAAVAGGIVAAIALDALAPTPSAAHLGLGERSLVRMFAAADAMVVGRALGPTRDLARGGAETRFAEIEPLAGSAPGSTFTVAGSLPPLRYPDGDLAVLLLSGKGGEGPWRSPQSGVRLSLPSGGLSEAGRRSLRRLWIATHAAAGERSPDPIDARATTAALVDLVGAPEPRLRSLAAVELAALADHPDQFPPETREAMARQARDPDTDASVRALLAVALGRFGSPIGAGGAASTTSAARSGG